MSLYLDCEFNGHGGQLISLALVSDRACHNDVGGAFYGVLPLPDRIHPWVAENVIPVLRREPETRAEFQMRLKVFLERHAGAPIIADWPYDFALLMDVMCSDDYERSWFVPCTMRLIKSGEVTPDVPHNALSDAWALMNWHVNEKVKEHA